MPKYRVLETSFVDNALVNEGAIIDYNPPEGSEIGDNLELVKAGKGKKADEPSADAAAEAAPADAALA